MIAHLTFNELLGAARRIGASDLHLATNALPLFRVDGRLRAIDDLRLTGSDLDAMFERVTTPTQRDQFSRSRDLDFAVEDATFGRLRVHAFTAAGRVRLAVRLLHVRIPTLAEVGAPTAVAELLDDADRKHGLILVSGATGQGKSTLLAAMIDHVNRHRDGHIVTIEDPVEYRHEGLRAHISQREVGSDVESFEAGILGALRVDPDIIMIGELRSTQAVAAALRAAETGHLVFGTVHSGDAAGAVDRIVDAFDEGKAAVRAQLAAALNAVISLRLLPRTDGGGRVLASEMLIVNDAARALLREGKTHQLRNVIATGRAAGMQTLEHSLNELLARRTISAQTALAESLHRDELVGIGQR